MKETRAALSLLIFIIAIHVAYLLPQSSDSKILAENFAPSVCPGALDGAKATLLLPSGKVPTKLITAPRSQFREKGSGTISVTGSAPIVEGDARNSVEVQSASGKWSTAVNCSSGEVESWFVGGNGEVSSRGKLIMDNSGLSDATVKVTPFTENGPLAASSFTIKAASEKTIRIDSLAPGAARTIFKVEVISGRVTTFFFDERVKGLKNLGGDFVHSSQPARTINLPAVPADYGKGSKFTYRLRLMATGKFDGTANVEVLAKDGVFVPVGLSEISFNSQEVVDIPIKDFAAGKSNFALKVIATTPVVAALYTDVSLNRMSDFAWITSASAFRTTSINLYGLEPTLTFVGDRISITIQWRNKSGKITRKSFVGDEILNWKVPPNTRLITITNYTSSVGALSWKTADGVAFLPLVSGAAPDSATRPIADIAVIQPST